MTIEERIEKQDRLIRSIQKQNRRLKCWVTASVILAFAAIIFGARSGEGTMIWGIPITTRRLNTKAIYVKTDSSKIRVLINNCGIAVFKANGTVKWSQKTC